MRDPQKALCKYTRKTRCIGLALPHVKKPSQGDRGFLLQNNNLGLSKDSDLFQEGAHYVSHFFSFAVEVDLKALTRRATREFNI